MHSNFATPNSSESCCCVAPKELNKHHMDASDSPAEWEWQTYWQILLRRVIHPYAAIGNHVRWATPSPRDNPLVFPTSHVSPSKINQNILDVEANRISYLAVFRFRVIWLTYRSNVGGSSVSRSIPSNLQHGNLAEHGPSAQRCQHRWTVVSNDWQPASLDDVHLLAHVAFPAYVITRAEHLQSKLQHQRLEKSRLAILKNPDLLEGVHVHSNGDFSFKFIR